MAVAAMAARLRSLCRWFHSPTMQPPLTVAMELRLLVAHLSMPGLPAPALSLSCRPSTGRTTAAVPSRPSDWTAALLQRKVEVVPQAARGALPRAVASKR
jgi:hypothetical protein